MGSPLFLETPKITVKILMNITIGAIIPLTTILTMSFTTSIARGYEGRAASFRL